MASVLYPISLGLSGTTDHCSAFTYHRLIGRNDRDITQNAPSYLSSDPATHLSINTYDSSLFRHCKPQKPLELGSLYVQAPLTLSSTESVLPKSREPEEKGCRAHTRDSPSSRTDVPESVLGLMGVPSSRKHPRRYADCCVCQPNSDRKFTRRNQLVVVGNNNEGRKGKLRCDTCRKMKSKVSS